MNMKLATNFTFQLKFTTIILGILGTTIGGFGLSSFFLPLFIIVCISLGISAILMFASVMDILKDAPGLRKFEVQLYTISGSLMILGILIFITAKVFGGEAHYQWSSPFQNCAIIIGFMNAALNFLIGWQLNGARERDPEELRPIYLHFSISHRPMKCVEVVEDRDNIPPPKYSEAYESTSRRNRGTESTPIVTLPHSHSFGVNI